MLVTREWCWCFAAVKPKGAGCLRQHNCGKVGDRRCYTTALFCTIVMLAMGVVEVVGSSSSIYEGVLGGVVIGGGGGGGGGGGVGRGGGELR